MPLQLVKRLVNTVYQRCGDGNETRAAPPIRRTISKRPSAVARSKVPSATEKDRLERERREERLEKVQKFLVSIEGAIESDEAETQQWLWERIDAQDGCVLSLVRIILHPKCRNQVALLCSALRAVQLLLQVANGKAGNGVVEGAERLRELVGDSLATQMTSELRLMAKGMHPFVASNALLVLAELGPCGKGIFTPVLLTRLLDLLVQLPDRVEDVMLGVLRVYAHGGAACRLVIQVMTSHAHGRHLGEVMLQFVNRTDAAERCLALEVLSRCLRSPVGSEYLYSNDSRVLVEILLRELPRQMGESFLCHVECLESLLVRSAVAREHRREAAAIMLRDLIADEHISSEERDACSRALRAMEAEKRKAVEEAHRPAKKASTPL